MAGEGSPEKREPALGGPTGNHAGADNGEGENDGPVEPVFAPTIVLNHTGAGADDSTSAKPDEPNVYFIKYRGEEDLPDIVTLVEAGLSEPYSVFTYRFFINNWPNLCWVAVIKVDENGNFIPSKDDPPFQYMIENPNYMNKETGEPNIDQPKMIPGNPQAGPDHNQHGIRKRCDTTRHPELADRTKTKIIGCIVSKCEHHNSNFFPSMRGYLGMLAVEPVFRRRGIAKDLVQLTLIEMELGGATECILETEITNSRAMRLYQSLGFIRHKRLTRYYLNGVDAFRFKYTFPDTGYLYSIHTREANTVMATCQEIVTQKQVKKPGDRLRERIAKGKTS